MRLAEDSRAVLESFFRGFMRDEGLRVPPVRVHTGRLARWLTRASRAGAITFGRRVLVAPSSLSRGAGRAGMSGPLLAHEIAHVLQYGRLGTVRFLFRYLREYLEGLRREGRCDAAARLRAYLEISFEREARDAEREFAETREA
jgi:hypothetical protein